jgi:hypothetical protein
MLDREIAQYPGQGRLSVKISGTWPRQGHMNPFLSHALKVDKVFGIIGIEDEVGPLDPVSKVRDLVDEAVPDREELVA